MLADVAVEKLTFRRKWAKFQGYKMSRDSRRSLIRILTQFYFCEFSKKEFFNTHRRFHSEPSGGTRELFSSWKILLENTSQFVLLVVGHRTLGDWQERNRRRKQGKDAIRLCPASDEVPRSSALASGRSKGAQFLRAQRDLIRKPLKRIGCPPGIRTPIC